MKTSIDQMKQTQDAGNNPMPIDKILSIVLKDKELGAEYVAIATPYDTPNAMSGPAQAKMWCDAIRAQGLKVWHRHSWASDEGFYGVAKQVTNDRIQDTKNWILDNPTLFKNGDMFTPKPEPQNMGIVGVNAHTGNAPHRFANTAAFNKWLRDMMFTCKEAFTTLGLQVEVGYWGFDGFIVCGYNNPDWTGKSFLEPATVQAMNNIICADHYPSLVGKPMSDFLAVFKKTWPTAKLFLGEYGAAQISTIEGQIAEIKASMTAMYADPVVIGINYWHMGPGGTEALLNDDYTKKLSFDVVKGFFALISTPTPTPTPTTQINIDLLVKQTEMLRKATVIVFDVGTLTIKINKLKELFRTDFL